MNTRVKKLRAFFSQYDIDALLIQKDVNIAYLTGFPAEESWLFVTRKKLYYITDFRYILEAKKCLKGVVIKEYTKSAFHTLFEIAKQDKVKRLGFDENHLTVAQFKRLKKEAPKAVQLKTANGLVENLRIIKDSQEIKLTREALRVHHKALKQLKRLIKPGKTERDIYEHLEKFIKAHKVGFSFPPIVASGPNAALPHAKITDRKFQANDVVLVDMGIDVKGYKSDLTRMFFLGKIPELVKTVHAHVDTAKNLAIETIRSGISVAQVDQQARKYLEKNKLSKYFGHALGHGVGLEIHENPRLSQKSREILEEGMIVTVEPGVYLPNKFGIRLEEMVLVTKSGCEILSDNIH